MEIRVGLRRLRSPGNHIRRLQTLQRGGEGGGRGVDAQARMIDPAQLLRVPMHMHQILAGRGDVEERVALRGNLRHAPADQQHEIGGLDARAQFRVRPDGELARIVRMIAGKEHGAARGGDDRQV